MYKIFGLFIVFLLIASCGGGGGGNGGCMTLDCRASKYNLFVADVDFTQPSPQASNIQIVASSGFRDMTHPRVSPDKNWVAYTTYNITNSSGCASFDTGYVNTEIKATRLNGSATVSVVPVTNGALNSNSYWYGSSFEFSFLSGTPVAPKLYRAQTDAAMSLIAGSIIEVTTPATITPYDPQAISNSQLVYGGQYNNNGIVKSIFLQTLNPPGTPVGLSLGRDSTGAILYGNDVMENDPKLSPDGSQVAFMRYAPNSGANGFGWRIFMVPVASPLTEVNISPSLGISLLLHDTLPEWVDNSTLVFSLIAVTANSVARTIWAMQSNGSGRKQVVLPAGYRYSDVFPFRDGSGNQKIVVSAEKISAACTP